MKLPVSLRWPAALATILLGSSSAMAEVPATADVPAMDCAKPNGPVETLICSDAALAAADSKLAGVIQAALAKVGDDEVEADALRSEQRRWQMQARDGCAMDEDPKPCLSEQYLFRTSELELAYELAPIRSRTSYRCDDDPATPITATIFETDPPKVTLERDGARMEASEMPADKGSVRFEGEDVLFLADATTAHIVWVETELTCKPEPAE